jgi:hypothetical protein
MIDLERIALAASPIRLYRPSNGSEGECFDAEWCARCERDRLFREDMDKHDGCPIVAAAMAYDIDDQEYPREWIEVEAVADDGLRVNCGKCTAFVPLDNPIPPPVDTLTPDLFDALTPSSPQGVEP